MNFYEKMAATASRLISKYGTNATLKTSGVNVSDKVTGTVLVQEQSIYDFKAIVKDYNRDMVDGTTILMGDKLIIAESKISPEPSDTIIINGQTWKVVDIKESNPAGVKLVLFIQVRK